MFPKYYLGIGPKCHWSKKPTRRMEEMTDNNLETMTSFQNQMTTVASSSWATFDA